MSKEITIICKKCGHKLPPGSVFCDKCGEPVVRRIARKNEAKKSPGKLNGKIMLAAAVGLILLGIALSIAFSSARVTAPPEDTGVDTAESYEDRLVKMSSRVTPEQYEQLDFGMSYDEVVALFGEEGTEHYTDTYVWPGEYFDMTDNTYDAPRVELKFGHTMKLIEIRENKLLQGEEIYASKTQDDADLVITEEQLASMKDRMSYREIADIIGAEGRLVDAESDKSGYDRKAYRWEYRKSEDSGSYRDYLTITFYNDKANRDKWSDWGA